MLQWIPSHCNIPGNETADNLAKEATQCAQPDSQTSYSEARTAIKTSQHLKWLQKHPRHNPNDPYHSLTRWEQVIIFRLRTGHNRLNYHLYTRFHIGESDQCLCRTGSQTAVHFLQSCPITEALRREIWPENTPISQKLYGTLADLRNTVSFTKRTGQPI